MMKLKKSLGQHLLIDHTYLQRIRQSISDAGKYESVIEVGPGQGALTQYLVELGHPEFRVIELDNDFAAKLPVKYPELKGKVIHDDVLNVALGRYCSWPTLLIGNFPYNISSQILFKVLDNRHLIHTVIGMFQKEVALRVASSPGSKSYGILSVLIQAFYEVEYLFDVPPEAFRPPPKVESGVIRLTRNERHQLNCDEAVFKKVVKLSFQQRRKMIRNSLKSILQENVERLPKPYLTARPEQLSVESFMDLTLAVEQLLQS